MRKMNQRRVELWMYFSEEDKFKIKKKLNNLIESISQFWEDPVNCNYTLNDKFSERRFNNLHFYGNIDNITNAIFNDSSINWNSNEINYLNDIVRDNKWKEQCLKKYTLSKISNLTNADIVNIYNIIPTEYFKYMFICNMLCSRVHCHLILNNYELLQIIKPLLDKYTLTFKYLIGYSWITLKNEEYNVYNKIKDNDRIIFDINTANLLPIYPFSYDDINQNPYAALLLDNELINLKKNCLSMNMMKNYKKYYGVCNSDEFSRRLNIFINGSNKKGILDNIDWSCCAISGSVMTACGMKYNPLIDISKQDNNFDIITDSDLSSFFFHYYQDSDIDLICNKISIYDFINTVSTFINKCNQNNNKTSVSNVHTGTIILSDEFIEKDILEIQKKLGLTFDIQYVKTNMHNQEIKNFYYDKYYIPWKHEQQLTKNALENNDEQLKEFLKPIPREEFRLYTLDYNIEENNLNKQDYEKYFYSENKLIAKLSESIRFKVKPFGSKTFEIFKSRDENFFSIVSRFHMGFVRAIWNGKTVKCLPSYISSMMLQIALDYKYFASIRDPIEIVNKYRSRGFGIILNDYEKLHMAYFNSVKNEKNDVNLKWIDMYNVNLKSKNSVENIFGTKKSSDDIFKPSKFFMGLPSDCYKNINHDTASSFEECFNSLISPELIPIAKFKAINDKGYISPLNREAITMGWNLVNNSNTNVQKQHNHKPDQIVVPVDWDNWDKCKKYWVNDNTDGW